MVTLFGERLVAAVQRVGAPVAVGLDPHLGRLPRPLQARFEGLSGAAAREAAAGAVVDFNRVALAAIAGRAAAVKPQFAFYEALGWAGMAALEETCAMARSHGLLVIGDGKRGDIASTAAAYAKAALDPDGPLGCDALTVNPWMGLDTLEPFLEVCRAHGRGIFVLLRTTNPGSPLLQTHGMPPAAWGLARELGRMDADLVGPSGLSSVGFVVGAKLEDEARELRLANRSAWFLVPGLGAQGGSVAAGLAGARADGLGALVVASRSVLYPDAPSEAYDADPGAFVAAAVTSLLDAARQAVGKHSEKALKNYV